MSERKRVTLIEGDGVGPEIMQATKRVLAAADVDIEWEDADAGAKVFKKGIASGVPKETIESIASTGVALKGPLETPVGFGEKSANVTLRKLFELYGNVRPARSLPGLSGPFSGHQLDIMVIRENVEDLYAGIEHMQTPGVAQCLKLISREGCRKIIELAFELANAEGRKKVHCATKANIMKHTEGMLKKVFEEIAAEHPEIESEHIIIDNCAHQLVRWPEQFDVIVTTNMNGDIISDLTSGLTGGLGLAPSANMGHGVAMFEAVHGSAPNIAGKDVVNPTALLLSSVLMLRHLGHFDAAERIEQSVFVTLEQGRTVTIDIGGDANASTTTAFTDAVINNLGRKSTKTMSREYRPLHMPKATGKTAVTTVKSRRVLGADVFIEGGMSAVELGKSLDKIVEETPIKLKMISNRGTKVYPPTEDASTSCVDHWRCRFIMRDDSAQMTDEHLADLVRKIGAKHVWMHIEKLNEFDGQDAFSKAQGED